MGRACSLAGGSLVAYVIGALPLPTSTSTQARASFFQYLTSSFLKPGATLKPASTLTYNLQLNVCLQAINFSKPNSLPRASHTTKLPNMSDKLMETAPGGQSTQ